MIRPTLLAAVLAFVGASSLGFAADQTILGASLTVKDPKPGVDATKRTVSVGAAEKKSPNLLVGNPVADGATIVIDLFGTHPTQQSFNLPQGTATATGKPFWKASATGFIYKDTKSEQGPVSLVGVKRSAAGSVTIKVKIGAKRATVDLVPPNLGTSGCVALTLGAGDRYSIQFGTDSTIANDAARAFSASKPASEGTCTPPTTTTTTLPDPCLTNNGGCDPLTSCSNQGGGAVCGACPGGYTGSGSSACIDINECATNGGGCTSGFSCQNLPGNSQCNDINECAIVNGGCDPLAACTNLVGSRTCGACPTGYTGSGSTSCIDINECATNNGGCSVLASCTNIGGGRTCGACPSGYTGNGISCADVNECAVSNGGCDPLATCSNLPGSRTCGACPTGYTGSGSTSCIDVNECATNNGGCGVGIVCTNSPGGRTCN